MRRPPAEVFEIVCRAYCHEQRAIGRSPLSGMVGPISESFGLDAQEARRIYSRAGAQVDRDLRAQSRARREGHDPGKIFVTYVGTRKVRWVLNPLN